MASTKTPWWRRILRKIAPFLFWKCPGGNFHWFWDRRICYCRCYEHDGTWLGGILVDGKECFTAEYLMRAGSCVTRAPLPESTEWGEDREGHRPAEGEMGPHASPGGDWDLATAYPPLQCPKCGGTSWGGGTDADPRPWCNKCGEPQPDRRQS